MSVSRNMPSRVLSAPRLGALTRRVFSQGDSDSEASLNDSKNQTVSSLDDHSKSQRSVSMHNYGFSDDEGTGSDNGLDGSLQDLYLSSDDASSKEEEKKIKKKPKSKKERSKTLETPPSRKKKDRAKSTSEGAPPPPPPQDGTPEMTRSLAIEALVSPTLVRKNKKGKKSSLKARAASERNFDTNALASPGPRKKKIGRRVVSEGTPMSPQKGDRSLDLDANLSPTGKKKKSKRATRKKKKDKSKSFSSLPDTYSVSSGSGDSFFGGDSSDTSDDDLEIDGEQDPQELLEMRKQALVEKALGMQRSSMRRTLTKNRDRSLSRSAHSQHSARQRSSAKKDRSMDALGISGHAPEKAVESPGRRNRRGTTKQDFLEKSNSTLDYKPQRSASVRTLSNRKQEKPPKRRSLGPLDPSEARRKKKEKEMDRSGHSIKRVKKKKNKSLQDDESYSEELESAKRNSKSTRDTDSVGSRPRRPIKKKASDVVDDQPDSDSDDDLSSVSDTGKDTGAGTLESLMASPRPVRPAGMRKERSERRERLSGGKSPFRSGSLGTLSRKVNNMSLSASEHGAAISRRLNNMSLSSSEHGRQRRSSSRMAAIESDIAKEEGDDQSTRTRSRRMGRRKSLV